MSRVIKKNGIIIITDPIIRNRNTLARVKKLANGEGYKYEKSFHGSSEPDYLVWYEFGGDFIKKFIPDGINAYNLFVIQGNDSDPAGVVASVKLKAEPYGKTDKFKQEPVISTHQIERLMYLMDKITLTENHINNLSRILDDKNRLIEKYNNKYLNKHTILSILFGRFVSDFKPKHNLFKNRVK